MLTRLLWLALLSPALATEPEPADAAGEAPQEAAPAPSEVSYAVASNSRLWVILRNDTTASLSRLGHDHVIASSNPTGTITWPMDGSGGCKVHIEVPVMGLVVDPPGSRESTGLDDNTIDEGDKQKLSKNMWGKSQLDASSFPTISFDASACSGQSGKVPVTGALKVLGKEVPVELTMDVTADASGFRAKGRFTTSHTALGFKPFRASPFGPRNADPLEFVLDVKAKPKG